MSYEEGDHPLSIAMTSFVLLLWVARVSASSQPYQLAASTESFGPDGPWQAVQVGLGNPPQVLNLYPAGAYQSSIYSKEICDHFPNAVCGTGGLFNASNSSTYDNKSMALYYPYGMPPSKARSGLDTLTLLPAAGNSEQKIEVPNFGVALQFSDNQSWVDDSGNFPPQVGRLSLGYFPVQTFGKSDLVSPDVNISIIPGILQQSGLINSTSFGLHVGSGALKLPLSLWLGGYDTSRVIGSVFSGPITDHQFQLQLVDIGFGVDAGASPISLPNQGVLSTNNPLDVFLDAAVSNLYLPTSVCESLTHYLPVTYQAKVCLYFWNTSDPQYTRIITSPSYLSFTFDAPGLSQGNITIKVPFQLLNLTLSPPVVSTPTSFFPCQPVSSQTKYILGRAFLQAAFLGVYWNKEPAPEWYLAQAPGPDLAPSVSPAVFGESVVAGAGNWSESWKNHWTLLADASQPSANSSYTAAPPVPSIRSSTGLSTGAKTGIAIGVVCFVASVLAALFFFHHRRGRRGEGPEGQSNERPPATTPQSMLDLAPEGISEASMPEPVEISNHAGLSHELDPDSELYEASNHAGPSYELSGDSILRGALPRFTR